ncbi:MAG: hypothetical protein J6U66_09260, partial [Lachnospiraceae bacterium]|nr:hypothetical protein [Lachnospiraceae bacterium]
GEPFKRVDALYIQSVVDSLMDLRLYTASGTAWRRSGYCVIVKDWTGYTLEHPYYYGPYTFAPAWKDTPMNRDKHQGYSISFEPGS